ncbi:Uncharacterised protein [Raoultella ornithinolytica]|nr:Uncharacterised protein [Raoultella ornithinolytica]VEB77259.1 Uncharacterised protein [Raoultella ornithinolytica]
MEVNQCCHCCDHGDYIITYSCNIVTFGFVFSSFLSVSFGIVPSTHF